MLLTGSHLSKRPDQGIKGTVQCVTHVLSKDPTNWYQVQKNSQHQLIFYLTKTDPN